MPLRILTFTSTAAAELVLRGGVLGDAMPRYGNVEGVAGLHGKQITFTQPAAATCTFDAGAGASARSLLTWTQVKTQLEAAVSGLRVGRVDGALALSRVAGSGTVIFDSTAVAEGTRANALLGLPLAQTGVVYGSPGAEAPPRWLEMGQNASGQYHHMVEEA